MNKSNLIKLFLSILLVISLIGCNNGSSSTINTTPHTTYAFIADSGGNLWKYKESNNGSLSYIESITKPYMVESWQPTEVIFEKKYAYIVDYGNVWQYNNNMGSLLYKESVPRPSNVQYWSPQNIAFYNGFAYITDFNGVIWKYNNDSITGKLLYSGESIPTPPLPNGIIYAPAYISFHNNTAYVSHAFMGYTYTVINSKIYSYFIWDNGNLSLESQTLMSPNTKSTWEVFGGINFNNNYAYVADGLGYIWLYEVSSNQFLNYVGQVESSILWEPSQVSFSNGYAYVADYNSEVWYYKTKNNGYCASPGAIVSKPPFNLKAYLPTSISFWTN